MKVLESVISNEIDWFAPSEWPNVLLRLPCPVAQEVTQKRPLHLPFAIILEYPPWTTKTSKDTPLESEASCSQQEETCRA